MRDMAKFPLVTLSVGGQEEGAVEASSWSAASHASPRCSIGRRSKRLCAN